MKKLILAVMLFIFVGFAYADLYTQLQDVFNFNSSTISSYKGVTFNTLPVNVGNSFHYNGTNFTGANYIKYPNGNIGALTTGTLSMWINLYALTGQQRLLQEASSSTGYELYLQTGAPSLYNGGLVNSPVTLPLNAWGLLTYTWNTTESHIYYNTTIILNTTAISFDFSSNSLLIGTYKTEATGFLLGQLDEIYIWNRTLNYSDVVLLYNSGNGTPSFFPFPISEAPPPPYYINLTANFTAPTPANNSIVDLALTPKVINISCNYTSDAGIYFNATKILNMTSTKFVNWTITPQYGNGTFLYYGFCNSSVTETRTITTFITPTYTALFTEQPANNSFLMPIITPIKLKWI